MNGRVRFQSHAVNVAVPRGGGRMRLVAASNINELRTAAHRYVNSRVDATLIIPYAFIWSKGAWSPCSRWLCYSLKPKPFIECLSRDKLPGNNISCSSTTWMRLAMAEPIVNSLEMDKTTAPMILIIGQTGAGKSHFCNRVIGEDVKVVNESAHLSSCNQPPTLSRTHARVP